ncbi:hypothetical protein GO495_29195 [Chitinophaga oryziterrae]|uniref:Uncharacterized protein n=1 Tax=Chitinophaga oryziterrae TaxID=1031224 RepID=A0A6N8JHC4_9BACT|nr:hypothetical protein [Chitinophaga oryziterrae]MVT44705.1 hypothetical protein [Chitinophaga oryziterrae]
MSRFETLVHAAPQQQFLPIDQQDIDAIIFELIGEKEQILEALDRCTDEKAVEHYVRTRQHQLVRLMDFVMETNDDISKHIFRSLGELLNFLEKDFSRYLDEDCQLPEAYLTIIREVMIDEIELVSYKIANLDEQLKGIVMKPYEVFLPDEVRDSMFTYHEVYYLQKLVHELYEMLTGTAIIEDVQLLLLQFDFNDPEYFSYFIDILRQNIDEAISIKDKKEKIFLFKKYFNQITVHPGMYLKKLHKPLKEQLESWLLAELSYLENYEGLLTGGYLPGELDIWKEFKVQTTLSVPQLGRLVGLLLTSGIILNKNKKELASFFSAFFTSPKSDIVTMDHVRNSFYDRSIGLANSIRDILAKLINLSRE